MQDTTINTKYFNKIDTNIKAYLLGFIAADGSIVKNNVKNGSTTLTITIHHKDIAILELPKSELNSELSIKNINIKSKSLSSYKLDVNHVRFNTSKKEIINDLIKHGIDYNKSLTMKNIIIKIPKRFRKSFIIGYFDGDGCFVDSLVNKNKHRYNKQGEYLRTDTYLGYNSSISIKGSKEFLQGIVKELKIKSFTLKQLSQQKIYTLVLTSNDSILKFYTCYSDCEFYLNRKKEKFTRKILQVQTISSS